MSYIDQNHRTRVAAAEQVELDRAFQQAVDERARRDAHDVVRGLARAFKTDSDQLYQRWLKGEDSRAVLVPSAGSRGEPEWRLGDPPSGVQPLAEDFFLPLVERGLARKDTSRVFFSARSGRSVELGTEDPRLHARDVARAKVRVAEIEQQVVTEAVPRALKQRLSKVAMAPELRGQVEQAIAMNDEATLGEILIRRQIAPGPDGKPREYLEARRWHPTDWPRLDEDSRPMGTTQFTIAELRGRVHVTEVARSRWGDEVVEDAAPAHWRE